MNPAQPLIMLAPMEGVLDATMRNLFAGVGGLDLTVTEFVRVTDQLLPPHVLYRYCPELKNGSRTLSGVETWIQFLGGQATPLAENAAQAAALGAAGIDLNFGCPAKTVNRHDGGATLLKDPARVFEVVSAVRKAVPQHIPVSAKVRLGFDHKDFHREIAQAAEAGGATRLTVHARTKEEMYRPPAHWEFIASMREAVHIPVVANGDIWTVEDYQRCREISGCESVALARGLFARPDLGRQIRAHLKGEAVHSMSWPEVFSLVQSSTHIYAAESPRLAVSRAKQWLKFLSPTYPEAAALFENIKTALNIEDLLRSFSNAENNDLHMDGLPLLRARQRSFEAQELRIY